MRLSETLMNMIMLFPLLLAAIGVFEAVRGLQALRYGERRAPMLLVASAVCVAVSGAMAYAFTH